MFRGYEGKLLRFDSYQGSLAASDVDCKHGDSNPKVCNPHSRNPKMAMTLRASLLTAATLAGLFLAQPVAALTIAPQSLSLDAMNESLVTTVARRGGVSRGRSVSRSRSVYRGRSVSRSRAVYKGRTVYRGGVYRPGVVRRGVYWGTAAAYNGAYGGYYGQQCGYYPYPPCSTGYYGGYGGGGLYRPGVVAYGRRNVYRRGVYRGPRVAHHRTTRTVRRRR